MPPPLQYVPSQDMKLFSKVHYESFVHTRQKLSAILFGFTTFLLYLINTGARTPRFGGEILPDSVPLLPPFRLEGAPIARSLLSHLFHRLGQ